MAESFIENYKAKHRHPLNRLTHSFGIPMIVVSLPLNIAGSVTPQRSTDDIEVTWRCVHSSVSSMKERVEELVNYAGNTSLASNRPQQQHGPSLRAG